MLYSIHHRALLRGMLAGGVALAGVSACSRSDRADAGRDTTEVGQTGTAAMPSDTQTSAATRPETTDMAVPRVRDTGKAGAETATPTPAKSPDQDQHHAMADTAAGHDVSTDTTAAGYQPMARDTSVALAQGDTIAQVQSDPTVQAKTDTAAVQDQPDTVTVVGDSSSVDKPGPRAKEDTVAQKADSLAKYHEADRVRPPEDSTETFGNVTDTTAQAAAAPAEADSAAIVARVDTTTAAEAGVQADTAEADTLATATEPIRPPEDSTEAYGQVTGEPGADTLATETEQIRPPEDSTEILGNVTRDEDQAKAKADVGAVGDANADAVGAAPVQSTGNIATGAAAVALMTREGQRCTTVDPDESRDVLWDLASSPATLNPCGTGTMTLPRIWTGEKK
jgi:hypothetical protein